MGTSRSESKLTSPKISLDASVLIGPLGGPGIAFRHLLGGLQEHGSLDLSVFALGLRSGDLSARLPSGVQHQQRRVPARLMQWGWTNLGRPHVGNLVGNVDLVHSFGTLVPPRGSLKQLVTVHDAAVFVAPEFESPLARQGVGSLRRAVREGAILHTPTEAVKAEVIEHLRVPEARVVVIPWGVPALEMRDPVEVDRWLPAGVDRYIVALGPDIPRKNLTTLVAAFDQLADEDHGLGLIVIGRNDDPSRSSSSTSSKIRHRNRITWTGVLSSPEVATLVGGATLLAFPSLYEGFGFPPLQAMAAGIPVVLSDIPTLREVAGDAALFVPPLDAGALAHAMESLLHSSALHRDLQIRGRRRVAAFDWSTTASSMVELYGRVLAHG